MTQKNYQMGPLNFQIRGEGQLCAAVREEFASILSSNTSSDIIFDFDAPIIFESPATISNFIKVAGGRYLAVHSLLRYIATSTPGSPLQLDIASDTARINIIIRTLRNVRAINWNYLSFNEVVAKNFIYGVFDHWTQIALLRRDATYIHASAIERNGNALLLAGRGGVGKSSFMLKSILEDGYRYLSDDLAVLDVSSTIWRSPKKMQIYGYNAVDEPVIRDALLKGRSVIDLLAWHTRKFLRGAKRVRRRVSAEHLFGPAYLAESATISTAVFLERHTSDDVRVTEIAVKEFAYRCATILLEELDPFASISVAEHSATDKPILPSISDLHATTTRVVERALQTKRLVHICIPEHFSPTELRKHLRPFLP